MIAGRVDDVIGPAYAEGEAAAAVYLDIALDVGAGWEYALPEAHNAFVYVYEGAVTIGGGANASRSRATGRS